MNEKTAELRDIFMDVTDDDTITEEQVETKGSLTENEREIKTKLRATIERMRGQLSFDTDFSIDEYETIVRGFYDEAGDTSLADRIGRDRDTVVRARHDLHLVREAETAFDADAFRRLSTDGRTDEAIADHLDIPESAVSDYRRVVETEDEIRRVNSRYTGEFEELLTDADLEEHTDDVTETGLEDATEGMETNVSM